MIQKVENEFNSFSKWFKVFFYVILSVYLVAWLFTIHLSSLQLSRHLQPILPTIPQDSEEYHNLAESILNDFTFYQNGSPDTLRAPGYPGFVALFKYIGQSLFVVTLIQILLTLFSGLLIRRLGIYFHSKEVGEIAASVFLLSPLTLTLSLVILTDTLFLFVFLLGFYLAISSRKLFFAFILFAFAIYVRPMGVFALPIFVTPLLVANLPFKEKIKSIGVLLCVIGLVVAPWVYRNYKVSGVADFTSFKAINLAAYAVPLYLSNKNHTAPDEERLKIEKATGVPQAKWKELQYSPEVAAYAQNIILNNPISYLKYHLTSSLPFLFSSHIQDVLVTYQGAMHLDKKFEEGAINHLASRNWKLFFASISKVWWKVGERIFWLLVYLVALIGVWQKKKSAATWGFVFIPVYLMLLSGPAANARYALQGLPFVLIIFATGLILIKEKFKNKYV